MKIINEVLESYLKCKYKGHLRLANEEGTKSAYELLLAETRNNLRAQATAKILGRFTDGQVERGVALVPSVLRRGAEYFLDATLEDDRLLLHFDGLKKVAGPSKLGDFHYVPAYFHTAQRIRKDQRHLLEILGLLLSRLQGRMPGFGVIWHGHECIATKVKLGVDLRRTERLLEEIKQSQGAEPPRLLLNDHCQVCEFRQRCHAQAVKEDNLSLLRGMGEKEVKGYARKGLFTVTQLSHTFRPRRKGKRADPRNNRHYHALQALAIRDKRIYLFGTPELADGPVRIYLDIEGLPEEMFVYLVGMLVCEGDCETRYSFWATSKGQENHIFEQFLEIIARHQSFLVYCYGSYEKAFLQRMQKETKKKELAEKVLQSLVNVLSLVYAHFYFPTYSNGLKDIGSYLGCTWSDENASGIQSIVWRKQWESQHEDGLKEKLVLYNQEDCTALKKVTELLFAIRGQIGSLPARKEFPPVSTVEDIDKLRNDRKWGPVNFFHAEYEIINNCAYFDYQRDRVFVRTSRILKKNRAKRTSNRRLRAKRFQITCSRCPACKSKEFIAVTNNEKTAYRKPRVKRAFNLVFTAGGIQRRVIECRTSVYRCLHCDHAFVSERYKRLDKHFHGLKSWAMFQHVAHRLSLGTVKSMIQDFFGLHLSRSEIHLFKSLLAHYYRTTYRNMLRKILSGNLLHVDETEVKLKTGKAYVWVFTNLEEVVFMYRPTREGDFLAELLKDFRGVLVSDFYAAYDSLDCPQQKCLIHLMRDMNQELLNNPFDEELQSVTRPFGTLLRAVVGTIDQHGLKRSHLKRHDREVAEYFRLLSGQSFSSEAAESLRQRLLKYQNKLFTFMQHDGVPWNNNNAENAIKRFAYYREDTVGTLKEAGLRDYLVLLSICHTCQYKGVSFLKFLLSRERDVDVFCQRKRRKRRLPAIELYPRGCVPRHLGKERKWDKQEKTEDASQIQEKRAEE